MLLLVKDTKFESKSQLQSINAAAVQNCFYWSKIQNLKANHNLRLMVFLSLVIAFTGQRYKIWKQITTNEDGTVMYGKLLLLVKDTKFESKSQQHSLLIGIVSHCFYWSKIQNLKANHNLLRFFVTAKKIAFTGQRYKIWKQITTDASLGCMPITLLLLVKDTKFESKSQLFVVLSKIIPYCFYWSKIQNLKANHNRGQFISSVKAIAFTGQRYKIWKQITTIDLYFAAAQWLLLLVKDTKFESKSQPLALRSSALCHCFYWSKIQNLKANHNR